MINKTLLFLTLNCSIFFCSCQGSLTDKEKWIIVNNHTEIYVLFDILEIYKDKYKKYPDSLNQIIDLYKEGETGFGFDSASVDLYIRDPFTYNRDPLTGDYFRYYLINDSSYILYSVGPNELDDNFSKITELVNSHKIKKLYFNEYTERDDGDILIYFVLDSKQVEY